MKRIRKILLFPALIVILLSCSHRFEGNVLDLGFYQWNMWIDEGGSAEDPAGNIPSCGWEEFHRGKGKLVRIPALASEHFPEAGEQSVLWFHCRFTLPEQWEHRPILLEFEGLSHRPEVWLNEKNLNPDRTGGMSYQAEVSGSIYYTLDNHLSIRITGKGPGPRGITGTIKVFSTKPSPGPSELSSTLPSP